MSRRAFNHFLMSLMLLIAQQMAIAHGMAHWGARVAAASAPHHASLDGGVSKSLLQDQGCDQCVVFAQLASAVGQELRTFAPPAASGQAIAGVCSPRMRAHAACGFRSRAPPTLV
jgi:hypothetical protein